VVKVATNANAKSSSTKAGGSETARTTTAQPNSATASVSTSAPSPRIVSVALPVGKAVKVPSLIGLPVRQVVEQAALAGLNLQVDGRGLVRSQQPAAGSQVQPGSLLVVHCAR